MLEYALIVSLIAVVCVVALILVGQSNLNNYNAVTNGI